jgi:predicted porin
MKKKLLAVAVVGALASPAAFAQTLYGIVDLGYQNSKYADGDVNKHFIQSGQHSGSRFGVRGSEDLAAGTYALYQIEFDITADTGATAAAGMTNRLTTVGLGSKAWGELTLGRQYTHTFHTFAVGSASGYGTFSSFYGTGGAASLTGPGIATRASNSVKYSSPVMGGFSVGALWAPGESTAVGASSNANYMDFALRYTPGPFGVAVSHAIATVEAGGVDNDTTQTQITANWDNRAWGIYGGYIMAENDGVGGAPATIDRNAWWINPVMRFGGRHELYFLYGQGENDAVAGQESTAIAITYQHVMSKRTRIYTSIGRVSNDNGANMALNAQATAAAGSVAGGYDPRGFQLGLLHSF